MRTGFTVSGIAHVALIALAIAGIGMSRPLDPAPVESIAVDLVPISEVANIRVGSLDSTVVDTESPSAVDSDKPAELAKPTGNTEEDQTTPRDNPDPTPAPTEQSAPAPAPSDPVVEPDPEPQPEEAAPTEPPPPDPAPEPEPEPEPEPAAVPDQPLVAPVETADPAEAAPRPVMKTAALSEKRAAYKRRQEQLKKQEADAKREAEEKKKADAKAAEDKRKADEKRAADKKKADEQKRIEQAKADSAAKAADEVADLINNEQSRGATTGEGGQATLGKETGRSATLSQSELDGLAAAMKACFNPPPGAAEEGATAIVEVRLGIDGMVQGIPQVLSTTGPSTADMTGSAAVRAVQRCGQRGYTFLPAEKHAGAGGWNTVRVTFKANEIN